uniref:Uncharacterized protein n=1 Tax=Guillardia theta TaxID=55529 RepID=A0A7S4NND4_GUITH
MAALRSTFILSVLLDLCLSFSFPPSCYLTTKNGRASLASIGQTREMMNTCVYAARNPKTHDKDKNDHFDGPEVEDEFFRVDMQTAQQAWSRAGKIAVQHKREKIERENSKGNPKRRFKKVPQEKLKSSDQDKVKILMRERMKLMESMSVEEVEDRVKQRILGKQLPEDKKKSPPPRPRGFG